MRPTTLQTFPVPAVGGSPVALARAGEVSLRVMVRNAGTLAGQGLVLAFDPNSLQPTVGSDVFNNIPAGAEDIFVVYPHQALFAIGLAATVAAVSSSEAFPLDIQADK